MKSKIISHTFTIKKEVVKIIKSKKTLLFREAEITRELLESLPVGTQFIIPSWNNELDHYDYDDIDTFHGRITDKNSWVYGKYHYSNDEKSYEGWIDDEQSGKIYIVVEEI